uniref:C2H2-type domain-containing protein n=1 Tax=Amblyomma maculatum TaxID=34609 RepID=G3MKF2_AMBMU
MAAPSALKCCRNLPLVVILGATGTGKSNLAIEIASKFNGEIISADSMQVYKSLDIITNKVTPAERDAAPHHLLDFLDPLSNFTVADFQSKALGVIDNLVNRRKLPIIVGGTNYYIESLLWKVLVRPEKQSDDHLICNSNRVLIKEVINSFLRYKSDSGREAEAAAAALLSEVSDTAILEDISTERLYKCLETIDPERALMLHPKDRRKIERSLQVFQVHGRPHSELIGEQQQLEGGSSLGGPLRFSRPCVLWLHCDQNVLDERLDARVDDMIEAGLIQEMEEFHEQYNKHRLDHNLEADYTKGIFQSIGFKEFHKYLLMDTEEKASPKGRKAFTEGLWLMKQVTKRYSRKQKKWIVQRFLRTPDRQVPPIYSLDATDVSRWDETARDKAFDIIADFIEGREPSHKPVPLLDSNNNQPRLFTCDICDVSVIGNITWEAHRKSKKHLALAKQKRETGECNGLDRNCSKEPAMVQDTVG